MKCHKDDSHNICLKVTPAGNHKCTRESDYLEAELQAAGVKVHGEPTQRKLMASPEFLFFWNCNFETPGTHLINLLLRVMTKEGELNESYSVKAMRFSLSLPTASMGLL